MGDDEEPKQKTSKGLEIPVPTREDFETMIKETTKPKKPLRSRRPKK